MNLTHIFLLVKSESDKKKKRVIVSLQTLLIML